MAKHLLAQYFGNASTTAFTVPAVTSGYMPYVEVNGQVVDAVYSANTFTISPAPATHDLIDIFETNDVFPAAKLQTTSITDEVAGGTSGAFIADQAAYIKTDVGTKTLAAAHATLDRIAWLTVEVTTAFANGDGAQPTLALGETSTVSKFAATSVFTGKAVGHYTFCGKLSATKALLATLVAGTGATETGAYTINWLICQKNS